MQKILTHPISLAFFVSLFFWFLFGASINQRDMNAYTLQQAGVEAIVDYHTFELGFSKRTRMREVGDVIHFEGRTLAAKQPGQFVFGAIPYFLISHLGLSYERYYRLCSALVTWLSASLMAAIALGFYFLIFSNLWQFPIREAIVMTLVLGLGTLFWPYSGVLHHDIMATSFLIISFYFLESGLCHSQKKFSYPFLLAGFFLGITLFTSMLPALLVFCFLLYSLTSKDIKKITWVAVGFTLGLLPFFVYNNYYFGNPFTPANVAGKVGDTLFSPNLHQGLSHFKTYFMPLGDLSVWKYNPIALFGFLGLLIMPKNFRRQQIFILGMLTIHSTYLLSIETVGHCQYGARYLIPLIPFVLLGIPFLMKQVDSQKLKISIGIIFLFVLIASVIINGVGSLGGTMYCSIENYGFPYYLKQKNLFSSWNLPLRNVSLIALAVFLSVFIVGYIALKFKTKKENAVLDI